MEEISLGNMKQLDDVEKVGNQEQIRNTAQIGTKSKNFCKKKSITERNRYLGSQSK